MKNIIMAAELGLLSFTQLQKLAQQQQQQIQANFQEASAAVRSSSSISNNNNSINSNNYNWMWNPKHHQENQEEEEEEEEDEDSWEVKAFEQDTTGNNIVTWPPRSYTCTFCRREFRSAQALGGHMNVHRRDRARLHQTLPTPTPAPAAVSSTSSATTLLIPAQEFGGGLCVLYSLPNPNGVNTSCMDSPSTTTVLSISPFEANNLVAPLFPNTTTTYPNSSASNIISNNIIDNGEIKMEDSSTNEELDLELRLGRR